MNGEERMGLEGESSNNKLSLCTTGGEKRRDRCEGHRTEKRRGNDSGVYGERRVNGSLFFFSLSSGQWTIYPSQVLSLLFSPRGPGMIITLLQSDFGMDE